MTKKLLPTIAFALAVLTGTASANDSAAMSPESPAASNLLRAREAFGHYLSAWVGRHMAPNNLKEIFAEDAVVELNVPAKPDWSLHIEGRRAIGTFVEEGMQAGSAWSFSDLHFFPTMDDDVVFAQFGSTVNIDGEQVKRSNLVVIKLDGTRIVHLQDLNGSPAVIAALFGGHRLAAGNGADAPGQ